MKPKELKCPVHKTEMEFIKHVENRFHKGIISHSKYRCEKCAYDWNYDGEVMWSDAPPRKVKLKKMPEVGDNYNDIVERSDNEN